MEEEESLAKKIVAIGNSITDETINNASNDELMEYLFLVEKLKVKLENAIKMEGDK